MNVVTLSYFESQPNYLDTKLTQMEDVMKDYPNKILALVLDKEDEYNYIQEIQFRLIAYRVKVFLFWSFEELADFLRVYTSN